MNSFQVIYCARGTAGPWESMGTTFDSREAAIEAIGDYAVHWPERHYTVLELTAEQMAAWAAKRSSAIAAATEEEGE